MPLNRRPRAKPCFSPSRVPSGAQWGWRMARWQHPLLLTRQAAFLVHSGRFELNSSLSVRRLFLVYRNKYTWNQQMRYASYVRLYLPIRNPAGRGFSNTPSTESRGNQPLVQPCCPCLVTHTRLFVSGLVLFAAPCGGLAKGRPPPGLFSTRP